MLNSVSIIALKAGIDSIVDVWIKQAKWHTIDTSDFIKGTTTIPSDRVHDMILNEQSKIKELNRLRI